MKFVLLGSTALVGVGLVAGNAQAAQGIQLGLGGYYEAAAGLVFSQSNNDGEPGAHTRDVVFRQDVEVHFKGEAKLDNGLTVGARIEMEGQQSNDQIDEVWAYFKGGWGQVRFGDDDDASRQLHYLIPSASELFGVDTPDFEFSNNHGNNFNNGSFQTNSTMLNISSDATKIIYFSPTFAGFSFAVSFAPDRRGENSYSYWSGPGGTTLSNNSGQVQNVISAALNFEHDFNGIDLATGIGFGEGQFESTGGNHNVQTSWGLDGHLIVTFAGFTVGGAGLYFDNWQSASGADYWVAGLGATYNWDAWTVGLAWSHGDYEYATSGGSSDRIDIVEVTGRYDLGPGLSLDGMVGYNTMNAGGGTGHQDDNTWEGGVGFFIGF
ncbi:porin [Hypericibacter terrae]|uniref:Porin n=1 Tax=Hypericibacter terrae TaxID=2602015 RepID=A0A5J6MIJ0_9PROT|nr:porin [Hypericibacter terrae]QEX17263.1 porin [Hypericibacter terrae]